MRSEADEPETTRNAEREREEFIASVLAAAKHLPREKREQVVGLLARRHRRSGAA